MSYNLVLFKKEHTVLFLAVICCISFLLRLYYFPIGIPISLDGIDYFAYSVAIVQEGQFPHGILPTNNGWPTFLSMLFYFAPTTDFFALMDLQRYATIVISVLTIIPVYLLCRRFVDRHFSLLGATLFCFEPRLIQNSVLGLTEPLFILLETITLYLFFSKSNKITYSSFAIAGLFALIRYEGLMLFIPLSLMFFVRFRTDKRIIFRYLLVLGIFVGTILPMAIIRYNTVEQDGLLSHLFSGANFVSEHVIDGKPDFDDPVSGEDGTNKILYFLSTAFSNFVRYFVWIMIPIFVLFLPLGIFYVWKAKDRSILYLISVGIFMLIPAIYAYGRNIEETRYLYVAIPLFCVISCYFLFLLEKRKNRNLFLILIIAGIAISSLVFLEYKKTDYEYERDVFEITRFVVSEAGGVNNYLGDKYAKVATMERIWPKLPELSEKGRITFDLRKISTSEYNSVFEYVKESKAKGLTHLVVMEKNNSDFLYDVFINEENYPYLLKVYDSKERGLKNHIKIYKINYERFEGYNNE